MGLRIEKAILRRVEMPLKFRFRTSFGETTVKNFLLLELRASGLTGWGECVAEEGPFFSSETVTSAASITRQFLLPLLLGRSLESPADFERMASPVRGNRMAKGMVSAALHSLFALAAGQSLSSYIGGSLAEIEVGVSLGLSQTVEETVANVSRHVSQGYRRIKLKIEPGHDIDRVAAVREAFPVIALTVDANAAYSLKDSDHLARLDAFHLDYIEQPLHHEDLLEHAKLATRIETPICLDESIRSLRDLELALALEAVDVVNIKMGRVGGFEEALRIEERAAAAGIPVWCGGMLESGVGRAHNIALASRAGFTKPGDTASASRYFDDDIVEPLLDAQNGLMSVPRKSGLGVEIRHDVLARVTAEIESFTP